MPIYEYGCTQCGFELDKLQKLNDLPLTQCPSCGKAALKKKVSVAGFRLKGSGWYETDFKKGSKKNLADSGDAKAPATSEGSGKSDTGKKESGASTAAVEKSS